jgi:hypothetical protein
VFFVFSPERHKPTEVQSQSIQGAAKDIVELTEGRIDVLINAAGSKGDPALKVWEIKGNELETEVRRKYVVFIMILRSWN